MPLRKGHSRAVRSANIRELQHKGKATGKIGKIDLASAAKKRSISEPEERRRVSVAISMDKAGMSNRYRKGHAK